jgi:hypothetical protein
MGRRVVQRQSTLHRHIEEVAQHGFWIGHGHRSWAKNKLKG